MIDRERFDRVQELFRETLLTEPDDPAAFLAARCGDDDELRRQVEALLAAHREADGFLETGSDDDVAGALVGRRLGRYRIVRKLAAGGMGTVFLAERADDAYRQRIAIKLLPGEASQEAVHRFGAERQILAGLEHPNIATLIDGGTTDDGLHFLAMEYVEGKPIDRYCDDRRLSVDERLELFLVLCDAVAFAHGNLVVHRDLKPGNVLIDRAGQLKLLDFGIAKLLNPELALPDAGTTLSMQRLLTPDHASPEQVEGGPITTASDVYSLGVLLYELLAGRGPYELRTDSPAELLDAVCRRSPEPPSVAVARRAAAGGAEAGGNRASDLQRLRRRLAGDLDAIVAKALAKKPEQRYSSVALLAEDLRRHLQGLTVHARRRTLGYRGAKFLRRYRWPLAATAAALVVLFALGGRLAWEKSRTESALAVAEAERERGERLVDFLVTLFAAPNPRTEADRPLTADEMLRHGAERLLSDLDDQPDVQARAGIEIGRVLGELGDFDTASGLLERAVATLDRLGDDRLASDALAALASIRIGQGDLDAADLLLRQARAAFDRSGAAPDADLVNLLHERGLVALHQGDLDSAGRQVEEALALHRELGGEAAAEAQILNTLGAVRQRAGDLDEAEAIHRRVLALRFDALGPGHLTISETQNNLGALLLARGEAGEASELFRDALAVRRHVLGDVHQGVATTWHNLACALRDLGDLAAAESAFGEAISIYERTVGRDHPYTAGSLLRLGTVLELRGDLAAAAELYRDSLAIHRGTRGEGHPRTAESELYLARLEAETGRCDEALERSGRAEATLRRTVGAGHWHTAAAATVRAVCLIERGETAAGGELLRTNLPRLEAERDPLARGFQDTAAALLEAGRP